MSGSVLKEVLKEVRIVREKVERLEELVEERLIGWEEPLEDEVKAIKEYMEAKEKGRVEFIRYIKEKRRAYPSDMTTDLGIPT